jgi:uncharacterized protein YjdB
MYPRTGLALVAVLVGAACSVPLDSGSDPRVQVQVVSVAIQPKSVTLLVGDSLKLNASVVMSDGHSQGSVTWTSSGTDRASVSASGMVRAVTTGNLFIRAASGAMQDSAAVAVVPPSPLPVASVVVTPTSATLTVGGSLQLAATPKDAAGNPLGGRTVTWGSSNTTVGTVTGSGLVTAVTAGSTTITATSEGQSASATLTMTAPVSAPGAVTDLAVGVVTDSSVGLSFTEVTDGTGQPASYDIRYVAGTSLSWGGSVPSVSRGTCATPLAGTTIGTRRTCTVLGLTAGTAYSFQLVAFRGTLTGSVVFGGLSNAVTATTAASTAPIASVSVTPASASVTVGNAQQVTATLKDASGNVLLGRAVAWTSNTTGVATVNGTGLVTGVAAGSATITATSEGQIGTATITVTAPAGGGTVLLQESFADGAFAARGWYDNAALGVTSAQHAPGSTSALELHFLPGATDPTSGGAARHTFAATPTLYVGYWVKYSANWIGSGFDSHPHEFYVLSNLDGQYASLANDWLTTYIETNFVNGAGTPRVSLQDNRAINATLGALPMNLIGITENRSVSGCNGVMETNLFSECYGNGTYNDKQFNRNGAVTFQAQPGAAGYKGNWNHVEVYLQMNSIVNGVGLPDGVVQYWFNGTLVLDRHDVLFRTGARSGLSFAQFVIAPYIGGTGSPADQTMWVDDLTLATSRP